MSNLDARLKAIEASIALNSDRFKEAINFDEMSEEALDAFLIREIRDEIKAIKNICNYHNVDIRSREGFEAGLRLYADKYCSDEEKEFYSDEHITLLGKVFESNIEKLF